MMNSLFIQKIASNYALKFTLGLTTVDVVYNIGLSKIAEKMAPQKPRRSDGDLKFSDIIFGSTSEELLYRFPLVAKRFITSVPSMIGVSMVGISYCTYLDPKMTQGIKTIKSELNEDQKQMIENFEKEYDSYEKARQYEHINYIRLALLSPIVGWGMYHKLKNTKYGKIGTGIFVGTSSLSFGLIHLLNYEEIKNSTVIITLMSQGVGGLSLSYIAMKFGLRYSILSHIVYNLSIMALSPFMDKKIDTSNA